MKRSKKLLTYITVFAVLMFAAAFTAIAEGNISVVLNGNKVKFNNAQPIIYEDRTLIPVRDVFEEMGCYVDWDRINHMAVIGNEEKIVYIPINSNFIRVYEIPTDTESDVELDVPAMIINDSTMIPLRAVGEALDADVRWKAETQTVYIDKE